LSTSSGFAAPVPSNPGLPALAGDAAAAPTTWAVEPRDSYMQRRAVDLRLDLANEDNRRSLELEYLSKNVPRGVVAKAWEAVAPLADRWLELAPQDTQAIVCQARARFALSSFTLPTLLASIEKAAQANRKSTDLRFLYADLVWETGDRKAFETALRAYAALVPAGDRQLAELVNRKTTARGDVDLSPRVAVAVAVAVLLLQVIATTAIGRVEIPSDPFSAVWILRHAILFAGTLATIAMTSRSVVNALRSLLRSGPPIFLVIAVVGGIACEEFYALYGRSTAPEGFSLPLAMVAAFLDVVLLRLFFQFALQHHFETAGDKRFGIVVVVFFNWLYAGTYSGNWVGLTSYFIQTGLAAATVALPSAALYARTRSILPAILWQFSFYALQVVLFQ
jgi:hypothetical protein